MYDLPEQRFRIKDWETVAADIDEAAQIEDRIGGIRRVFLCDGDALILPTDRLEQILGYLRERLPGVRRVGLYGDARSILRKSVGELQRLRDLGLGIVYHGVESGDDEVLARVCKGSQAAEAVEAAHRLRAAGLRHSVMVMLGLGGVERSGQHASATADLLTDLDPPYVGALTTTLVPGTPLAAAAAAGRFELPDRWGLLTELRTLISESRFSRCRFHANHASNYLPLSLNLPVDRRQALERLDQVLRDRDESHLRSEYRRGL